MNVSSETLQAAFDRELRPFGARFDPEVLAATRNVYRPHVNLEAAGDESTNLAYGTHERHRLDVYRPQGVCRAIVLFVHGGGFVAGDKNGDGVFYANVGRWLARNGYAAVLINYRLAPAHPWPAGARDLALALAWVRDNLASVAGGDAPIVVWGQSAGASHVASWLFDEEARGGPLGKVAGVMLMSGYYELAAPLPAGPKAYFGDDEADHARRAPVSQVGPVALPILLSLAELDPDWLVHHTYGLARALSLANGRSPDFQYFRGHNHVSTVQSLGSPQQDVANGVLGFLQGVSQRAD